MSTALIISICVTVVILGGLTTWAIIKQPVLSTKIQSLIGAISAGVMGYLAYFIALPPNLQTGMLGEIINVAPPSWQPALAATTKTLSVLLGAWATYKAAHSGPQTPPTNPPK